MLLPSLRPFKGKFNVELFVWIASFNYIFHDLIIFYYTVFFIIYLQFKDGKNKTVQQWLDVSGTRGVYSKRFTIPRHSNKGFWRVVVESMVKTMVYL